ncbi:clathrin light chain [Teleopsis dalmanni]|uniref:clathrin light chain n=1 Tax=Teleopsis dalmanni TaxID=139649 RepID=UPI0018CFD7E9|nr:clathrin light chain [Teleopsis dalmanni]
MDFDDFGANREEIDPAAEFLAREHSVLGDLEAEIILESNVNTSNIDDSVPTNDEGIPVCGGLGSSTGSFELISGESNDLVGLSGPPPSRVEPEKIRLWREEQKKRLEEKDKEEQRKKEELRQQAKQELEHWLRQTDDSIEKTKTASRNAEKHSAVLENDGQHTEQAAEWERIAKLCDFNPKVNKCGKDVSRMRSIYLHLKQTPISSQKTVQI